MQLNKHNYLAILVCVAFVAVTNLQPAEAFGPITLTLGTTAVVLTGTQVAIGVAALAGLAIAKEKIVIADLARRNRGYDYVLKPVPVQITISGVNKCQLLSF
jgi:hypothetical protein